MRIHADPDPQAWFLVDKFTLLGGKMNADPCGSGSTALDSIRHVQNGETMRKLLTF